jgi:hypothetical protein
MAMQRHLLSETESLMPYLPAGNSRQKVTATPSPSGQGSAVPTGRRGATTGAFLGTELAIGRQRMVDAAS